ncbi:MAG: chromate transporter [Saccharofermentans sp.]|nr:chromate transporter [Saccharofermentans sp.]
MKKSLSLFLVFFKIGLFTFGGGYAMLALIEDICVEKKKWITHEEMMDITVIAESTPGPIAINLATYVGYKLRKIPGAIIATLGMIIPSFCIIFLISQFLDRFLEIKWVSSAFQGIKIAVAILIIDAAVKMIRKMKKKPFQITMMIAALISMLVINVLALHVSSLVIMLAGAAAGLIFYAIHNRSRKETADK